jgi:hypothetical protein
MVNSDPNKMGQFSFVHHPLSHKISSAVIHHTLTLTGWLLTTLLLSEVCSEFHPANTDSGKLHSLSLLCSFVGGGWCNLPTSCSGLCSQEDVWCVAFTCWVCRFTQIWIQASEEKWWTAFPKVDYHWDSVKAGRAYASIPQVRGPEYCRIKFYLITCLLHFCKKSGGG